MVSKSRQDFEAHWGAHASAGISTAKEVEARHFLRPAVEHMQQAVLPMRVLDVGCGDGIHALALAKEGVPPHTYHGVDLSYQAARIARTRISAVGKNQAQFHIGNALFLPFRPASFDVVFSYGVIGYTGMPEPVIDEMVRVCRPGGIVGIWVYPRLGGIPGKMFTWARIVCSRMGGRLSRAIVYAVVPFLSVLPVRSGMSLRNSSWRQCIELVEVNLLPRVLEFYSWEDALGWFQKRHLEVISADRSRPVEIWARA